MRVSAIQHLENDGQVTLRRVRLAPAEAVLVAQLFDPLGDHVEMELDDALVVATAGVHNEQSAVPQPLALDRFAQTLPEDIGSARTGEQIPEGAVRARAHDRPLGLPVALVARELETFRHRAAP